MREVFVQLYEESLIYRGEYLVNWCPRCTTAISDLEVEYEPTQGKLWHIRYPLKGNGDSVVVATTRPETMLGDTAVAFHPEDERYGHVKGRTAVLPLMQREIPLIADGFVDREFGTGVVKVTPGHDPHDFQVGQRHKLPTIKVIGEHGSMTEAAGNYAGLERYEARARVVEDLEKQGFLVQVEDHSHNVGHCQRCQTVIEPLVSTQWFVKMKPLAEKAIQAVEEKRTVFVPANYEKVYFEWLHNIHDWCISRQLWWGIVFLPGTVEIVATSRSHARLPRTAHIARLPISSRSPMYWIPGSAPVCGPFRPWAGRNGPRIFKPTTRPVP